MIGQDNRSVYMLEYLTRRGGDDERERDKCRYPCQFHFVTGDQQKLGQ